MGGELERMLADADAAGMAHPVRAEVRTTEANHYQASRLQAPPVRQLHLVCAYGDCAQSVFCLSYDVTAGAYLVTLQTLQASVTAHVLQCHTGTATPHTPRG